jgi:hypothetical protein
MTGIFYFLMCVLTVFQWEVNMLQSFIPPHGGYKKLLSYQKAKIVYDATVFFCARFLKKNDRTYDQMIQAARSGNTGIIKGLKRPKGPK